MSEKYPHRVIGKAHLSDVTDGYIRDSALTLVSKNDITIDPLADEGHRLAYELVFQDSPENDLMIICTFTYSDEDVYIYSFLCARRSILTPCYRRTTSL